MKLAFLLPTQTKQQPESIQCAIRPLPHCAFSVYRRCYVLVVLLPCFCLPFQFAREMGLVIFASVIFFYFVWCFRAVNLHAV